MATALSQSDTTFSDCSISFLLPRTLGSSVSAGCSSFESDDLGYMNNLFSSTALNNPKKLLEHAKMINNGDCSSILNESFDDRNNRLGKRRHGDVIELQDKRSRQRRRGLPGAERVGNVFNFSVKATAVEGSQMGIDGFSKRSHCFESNSVEDSQSWPVIDYSCLEDISDPMEYFSTCRKLENAEKELKKLKGEASPKLNQPHGRRDRKRRPGLPDNEGEKKLFKFPGMTGIVENSQIENFTQSNSASVNESPIASYSKEISQIENSQAVEPEKKLTGKAETCDKEIDEFERLLSKCRDLDNDGISNFLRETFQINPIHVEKSGSRPFSAGTGSKFESPKLSQISLLSNRNKIDRLSNLKRRFSFMGRPGDPFLFHETVQKEQSDGFAGIGSNCKVFCDVGLEKLPSSEREKQKEDLGQETLKTKLLDTEMKNSIDHLSAIKKSISLIDVQGRLAKISTLKKSIMQNTAEDELLMFSHSDLEESSLSERREMRSCSPVAITHFDGDSMDVHNALIPGLSNQKRPSFVDKMHSPVAQVTEEEDLDRRNSSDPIGSQVTLLENTCQQKKGTISVEEHTSIVSSSSFKEAIQTSTSVDCTASVNTNVAEQILHAAAPDDATFPENLASIDVQLEAAYEALNGRNKDQEHSEPSAGPPNQNSDREKRPRRRREPNSILRTKSLAGAGSAWEFGVRRSTRIKVKPLQYWCGERLLYGRVHDSLATVIGVKKYETPQRGRKSAAMKVRSFVSEEYADLVAQAALH